jgi:PAS domain S-box-containing protein
MHLEWITDAFIRIAEYQPEQMAVGTDWLKLVHGEDRAAAQRQVQRLLAGQIVTSEFRIVTQTGKTRWIRTTAHPTWDAALRRVVRIRGAAQDITETRQVEQSLRARAAQQEVVADLGQRALGGLDTPSLMNDAVRQVAESLGVELVEVLELDASRTECRLRAAVGWSGPAGPVVEPIERDSLFDCTLQAVTPIVFNDLARESRFVRSRRLDDRAVASGVCVVIEGREQPFGILGAYTTSVRCFGRDEVHFLQAVANVLASAIQRNRAEAALSDRENLLRTVIEAEPDGVCLLGPDGVIRDMNRSGLTMLEAESPDPVLGQPVYRFVASESHEALRRLLDDAFRGQAGVLPHDVVGLRGGQRSLETRVVPLRGPHHEVIAALGIARDTTERKRDAEALSAHEARVKIMVHQLPVVLWSTDTELRFTSSLGAGLAALNLVPNLVVGMSLYDYFQTRDRAFPEIAAHLRALAGESVTMQSRWNGRAFQAHIEPLRGPEGTICGTVGIALDITERKQTEHAVRQTRTQFRAIFEGAPFGIAMADLRGYIRVSNAALSAMLGRGADELRGCRLTKLAYPEDAAPARARLRDLLSGKLDRFQLETRLVRKDGQVVSGRMTVSLVRGGDGNAKFAVAMCEDITERKRTEDELRQKEAQYRQAQKMEAIGRLAGGIAHDFNNLLGVILNYADFAIEELAEKSPVRNDIEQIRRAADRAASLTRQLLIYSRREVVKAEVTDLNSVVTETERLLERTIGEDIEVRCTLAKDLQRVLADPGHLQQVLLNLAINARDAMPGGGTLCIETANMRLTERDRELHPFIIPGDYVSLSVSDTGCGMSDDVKSHVFEPYFTTKPAGKGTGLGLAMVYAIVKQAGGYIWLYSEEGLGSTFRICLPATRQASSSALLRTYRPPADIAGRGETVLLVEDEDALRAVTYRILAQHGYSVLEAANGADGFDVAQRCSQPIDLLLTDVVMPRMSGADLATRLRAMWPEMRVLFTSGYTDDVIAAQQLLDDSVTLLQKPFTENLLLQMVREVLDAPSREVSNV